MTTDRDTTARIVRSWLKTEEHESADRVLDIVFDRLDTTPQRRATPWPAWRTLTMNKFVTIGLGATAVLVALVIAAQLLPSGANTGGVDASASPEPTATAEPTASPVPTPQGLPEGPHVLWSARSEPGSVPMTVTIPAAGWFGSTGDGTLTKNDSADPPDGAGTIVWAGIENVYVYGDPCEWSSTQPDTPATTVDEAIAALGAQASRDASAPVDITVGGYTGKGITLHVPDDANFAECDQGLFSTFSERLATDPDSVERYAQGPGQIDEVWILDVDGRMVLIDWTYYEGTPRDVVEELRAIVESATFD